MSISVKATSAIARRRGGDDWDLSPSAADNLATAQIQIIDGPKEKAAKDAKRAAEAKDAADGDSAAADDDSGN